MNIICSTTHSWTQDWMQQLNNVIAHCNCDLCSKGHNLKREAWRRDWNLAFLSGVKVDDIDWNLFDLLYCFLCVLSTRAGGFALFYAQWGSILEESIHPFQLSQKAKIPASSAFKQWNFKMGSHNIELLSWILCPSTWITHFIWKFYLSPFQDSVCSKICVSSVIVPHFGAAVRKRRLKRRHAEEAWNVAFWGDLSVVRSGYQHL